jgi:DNA (cytosine-5)-methyltransferase 1
MKSKKHLKIFSFFAGSGFLDLGFEHSDFDIVFVNEIHPSFLNAYRYSRDSLGYSYPEHGYSSQDIRELTEGEAALKLCYLLKKTRQKADFIGFIGGPPCPDFSIGGKNKGFQGAKGQLSESYIELICQQKPDFFLFENVKGLYRTKKHRSFFETLKIKLQNHNYFLTERLVNTIEYGTPQDRERIILLGFHGNLLSELNLKVIDKENLSTLFPWEHFISYPKDQVFSYPWIKQTPFQEDSAFPFPKNIPIELTVEYWFRRNDVLNHPNSIHHFKPRAGLSKFLSINEGDDLKKSYKRLHRWRYSPTACYGNNEVHLHPYKPRRISVAEALAIQSLPKKFTFPDYMSLK